MFAIHVQKQKQQQQKDIDLMDQMLRRQFTYVLTQYVQGSEVTAVLA